MAKKTKKRVAFVVSDVSGRTGQLFARSVLDQFKGEFETKRFSHVRDSARLPAIIAKAKKLRAWVLYTLVDPRMCQAMELAAHNAGVKATDLMSGPLRDAGSWLHEAPLGVPQHRLTQEMLSIAYAVDFTEEADDGKKPELFLEADILLVGISRTSKTMLGRFLAQSGHKVANMPFTDGSWEPAELKSVDPRRVFVLSMDPQRIVAAREKRRERDKIDRSYAEYEQIVEELKNLRQFAKRYSGWTSIYISGSIEESAAEILEALDERFPEKS